MYIKVSIYIILDVKALFLELLMKFFLRNIFYYSNYYLGHRKLCKNHDYIFFTKSVEQKLPRNFIKSCQKANRKKC
jgi:hypothetical protein